VSMEQGDATADDESKLNWGSALLVWPCTHLCLARRLTYFFFFFSYRFYGGWQLKTQNQHLGLEGLSQRFVQEAESR
jgi:hypothetical protein